MPKELEIEPLITTKGPRSRLLVPGVVLLTVIALTVAVVWLALLGGSASPAKIVTEYDVIVIGIGTAGSVVAARLSEDPNVRVLALEGGGSSMSCNGGPTVLTCYAGEECLDGPGTEYSVFDVPLFWGLTHNSALNWTWGSRYPKSVGRVLGGSAAHNDFVWLRGQPNDFNSLDARGIRGWEWPTVLEYYKKAENFVGKFANDTAVHGSGGPITVTDAQGNPKFRNLQDSAQKLGYPVDIDINSPTREGFGFMQSSLRQGRRSCSGGEYLCPALQRGNLEVRRFADVREILFRTSETGQIVAEGVRYVTKNGETVEVKTKKAVVLSAGNWGSPYILLRSGVGPQADLEALGLRVVKDVPGVGKNSKDEVVVGMLFDYLQINNPPRHALQSAGELYEWLTQGTGQSMMTTEGGFIKRENSSAFDIHVRFFTDDPDANIYLAPNAWPYCNVTLSPDLSRLIKSCAEVPAEDIEELAYAIEEVRKITAQEPLKSYQVEISPGPGVTTRDQLRAWVKTRAGDYNHGQGSLRMGGDDDPEAVLDETLQVRGIEGLWVADNSVFPNKVAHDGMASATMAGERGADFVKQKFGWK